MSNPISNDNLLNPFIDVNASAGVTADKARVFLGQRLSIVGDQSTTDAMLRQFQQLATDGVITLTDELSTIITNRLGA